MCSVSIVGQEILSTVKTTSFMPNAGIFVDRHVLGLQGQLTDVRVSGRPCRTMRSQPSHLSLEFPEGAAPENKLVRDNTRIGPSLP